MLKLGFELDGFFEQIQPPSGGCVLKRVLSCSYRANKRPAAFGRLCVETILKMVIAMGVKTSRLRAAVC